MIIKVFGKEKKPKKKPPRPLGTPPKEGKSCRFASLRNGIPYLINIILK
jgi:hypothetical protein